jgi:hypothetical protein
MRFERQTMAIDGARQQRNISLLLFVLGSVLCNILFFVLHLPVLISLASCALIASPFILKFFVVGARTLSLIALNVTLISGLLFGLELVAEITHDEWVRDTWSEPVITKDPDLGTIPRANVTIRHRRYPQTLKYQLEWDVTYRTEPDHSRQIPDRPTTGARFAVFGDSFMFGEGLNDEETISNQLQKLLPEFRVFNYAVSGHSTAQNYLYLKRVLERSPETKVCLVGFITDHVRRTAVPYELMASWGRELPIVRRQDGRIINLGRGYDILSLIERLHVDLISGSILYRKFSRPWQSSPSDWELVEALVVAMRELCETGDSGRSFALVVFPAGVVERDALSLSESFHTWEAHLRNLGVLIIDLEERFDAEVRSRGLSRSSFFFQDSHPNARYAKLVAQWIGDDIVSHISRVK